MSGETQVTGTQWPRWEVFKQDAPGKPHQAVGSVHAVGARHALFTARTVFVRRPSAVSLWVAPESEIYSKTAEELEREAEVVVTSGASPSAFLIFRKTSHKRSMTFADLVGEVRATSPAEALSLARARFPEPPALAWWVVPGGAVVRSDEDEDTIESWFAPARDKTYRQQSAYGVVGKHAGERKKVGDRD